jgi:hypothetical protein
VIVSKIPTIESSFSEIPGKAIRPTGADFSTVLAQRLPQSGLFDAAFLNAGRQYDVSPALLKAVASAESGFNPDAISPAGAVGLMQIMPETAQQLGIDPRDPVQSIQGAASYLRTLLNQFNGDATLAIAAYNAGPGAVSGYGGIPPFKETQDYVARVAGLMQQYSSSSAGPEAGNASSVPENNGSQMPSSGCDPSALADLLLIMTEAQGINALSTPSSVDTFGTTTTEAEDDTATAQSI